MSENLSIAHVTPYAWEAGQDVNEYIKRVTEDLAARGHRVLVIAPSDSPGLVNNSRRAIKQAEKAPESLFGDGGAPRVLGVGEVLPVGSSRRGTRSLPVDVARTVEQVLTQTPLDIVHAHEPWAPSTAAAALRHSRALNVGTFHAPLERVISTQVARKVVELFFGRIDIRHASYEATADLMHRYFPAAYDVVLPGTDVTEPARDRRRAPRIGFMHGEERPALRVFLRGLRRVGLDPPWDAAVWSPLDTEPPAALRKEIRDRLSFSGPSDSDQASFFAGVDIAVFGSAGEAPAPGALMRALAAGAVPVAARLPVYEELLADGEYGLLFEPGDFQTLAGQIERLVRDPDRREHLCRAADDFRRELGWQRTTDTIEDSYLGLAARRHDPTGNPGLRKKLAARPLIDVDLHMHTDHSHDCATPVEVLLATARDQGLGAIAVTDHNEVSGAHEARDKAAEYGVKVIVAEEVKTAHQGEVIGLFIEEKIPRGLTLQETIAEIKAQGGLVYVPHPFDRMHAVPDYEHMLDILDDVDAIEIFNPRIAFKPFNEEAVRFAAKYRIVAGAGSDSHVAQGLGSVRIRMRDFDGPEEFLESLRDADIIRKPTSLLYVQALKFLETKATPAGARKARRDRRVRRAVRK